MTYLGFPILSLVYTIIFLTLYYSKKRIDLFENKLVITLMKINAVGLALELGCYLVLALLHNEDTFLGMFILKSYVAYIAIFDQFLNAYIFVATSKIYGNTDNRVVKKYYKKVMLMLLPVTVAIVLTTYLAPLYYNNVYPRYYSYGLATDLLVYSIGILLPIWIFRAIRAIRMNKNRQNKTKMYLILIGVVLIGSSGALTNIIDKSILLITTAECLMVTLMYFTIENPDMKLITELANNRKLTESNVEEKSNLLFQVSQEVKTPLMQITNLSSEINKSNDKNEIQAKSLEIENTARNVMSVINNVLDISQMDTQNIKITNNTYDIYKLLKEVVYLTKNKYRNDDKNIDFKYSVSNTIPTSLYGDSLKLKQIICSILFNAFENTEEGYIDLDISHMIKYNLCRLIITISDTGKGLSYEEINSILEDSKEISEQELAKIDDLNINLKMVKKIIDLLGGSLLVKSDPEIGSTFTIILNQKIAGGNDSISPLVETLSNKQRVLLIDDDYLELDSYAYELKKNNLEVISTMYGYDCIEKLANKEKYDLILVDDELKEYNAINILEDIKKLKIKNQKVIIMIEKEKEFMKDKFLRDYPFADYLLKDNFKSEIKRIISKYL